GDVLAVMVAGVDVVVADGVETAAGRRRRAGARIAVLAGRHDVHRTHTGGIENGDEAFGGPIGEDEIRRASGVETEVRRVDAEAAPGSGNVADVEALDSRLSEEVL